MPSEKTTRSNVNEEKIVQGCMKQLNENFNEKFSLIIKEAIKKIEVKYNEQIDALKLEIQEVKSSQEFICANYDNLKKNYDSLCKENVRQAEEIKQLRSSSEDLEKQTEIEASKRDQLEQYGRRQNLEFHGVPEKEDENPTDVVIKLCKSIGANIERKDVSIAHRLPKKKNAEKPPAIIAKFISTEVRNLIYKKRVQAKNLSQQDLPIAGMSKLYINENLTQARMRLLWKTKQAVKDIYQFVWTRNGNIYVRRNSESEAIAIGNEFDISEL